MDYEKKYNEAIKRAKQHCADYVVETIFPELKESEGEKIRKEIITYLSTVDDKELIPYESWIAWLEKQGEPTEINPSEFDMRLNKLLKQFKSLPKDDIASSLSFYLNVVQNDGTYKEEKQGEQQDVSIQINPSEYINDMGGNGCYLKNTTQKPTDKAKPNFKVKFAGNEYNVLEVKDIAGVTFYGIEDEPNHIDYVLPNTCEIVSEQNPAWSEEDYEHLERILKELENQRQRPLNSPYLDKIESDYNWLKSLRPQNTWKPSDEQMDALETAVSSLQSTALESLYQKLNKLM